MAGLTDDLAEHSHAAVDRRDHAERQIHRIEHRALLDMHFDEAEIIRRIALDSYYLFHSALRRFFVGKQSIQHRNAIFVGLLQPSGIEVASQCA